MNNRKKHNINLAAVKFARSQSRKEEIAQHGKPVLQTHVQKSKKIYDRKKFKNLFRI